MQQNKTRTTEKDFQIFKDEVYKYLRLYQLEGAWDIYFAHCDGNKEDELATTSVDIEAMCVTFRLYKDWSQHIPGPSIEEVKATARHEVRHLLLMRVHMMACQRNLDVDKLNGEIHSIIHCIEMVERKLKGS